MRVLLVAYSFPPKGSASSLFYAKTAKGLADRGWDVDVLTVADQPTFMTDTTLLAELPPTVRILRAYSLEPTRAVQAYRRAKKRFVGQDSAGGDTRATDGGRFDRKYTTLPEWVVRLARAAFIPDEKVGWTPWAVREALRAYAKQPYDVVLACGPRYSAYGVGWRVARRLSLPLVSLASDPIVGNDAFRPPTPVHALLMRRYERKVIANSRHVLMASARMHSELLDRNPGAEGRVTVFSNGFDPKDFSGPPPGPHEDFVICFVGTMPPSRKPDVLLDALTRLVSEDGSFARDVKVRFVGPRDSLVDGALHARDLDSVVERTGFVPHAEAVHEMRRSDVLLLVLGPEGRATLTSKLPEYLAAGKAILALVPKDSAAAEVVRRAGAGEVVDPENVEEATDALARMYRMWKEHKLPAPKSDVVAEFNWDVQLGKLNEVLEEHASRLG